MSSEHPKCFIFFSGFIIGLVFGGTASYYYCIPSPKEDDDDPIPPHICEPIEKKYMY